MYLQYKTLTKLMEKEKQEYYEKKNPQVTEKSVVMEKAVVKQKPKQKPKRKWLRIVLLVIVLNITVPLIIYNQSEKEKLDSTISYWLECGISYEGMKKGLCEGFGYSEEKAEKIIDKYDDNVNWYDQAVIRANTYSDEMDYNAMVDALTQELFTEAEAVYGAESIYGTEKERAAQFAENYVAAYGVEGLREAMEKEGFSLMSIDRAVSKSVRDVLNEYLP